jgi:hypothetical protein
LSHASESGSPLFHIVNRVVDSFDVRVYRDFLASKWLEGELDEWRGKIQNSRPGEADFVSLPGLGSWQLKRAKRGAYEFTLINRQIADVQVWNPAKWRGKQVADTGQLYVSFRSGYLQRGGITGALEFVERLCKLLFGSVRLLNPEAVEFTRISRADLAVDYADMRVLKMNAAERAAHSTIQWEDLDLYQTRGKRTKREAWLTPFNGSGQDEIIKVLRRSRQESHKIQGALKALGLRPSPGPDNRGGHCDTTGQNGGSSDPSQLEQHLEKIAVLDGENDTAIALERTVMLLADMLIEGIQADGKAQLTRVIGGRKPQTIYLGRFGSELYAREYHKQATLVTQNKGYLLDTWLGSGWNPETPVWRLEFSLSGDFLRQFVDAKTGERVDLRDPVTFAEWIPRVWAYLTRTWMRHTQWSSDANRSRWLPSIRWQALQNAWKAEHEYLRLKRPSAPTLDVLHAAVRGNSKSYAAKLAAVPELRAKALERLGLTAEPKDRKGREAYWKALLEECKAEVLSRLSVEMFGDDQQAGFDADVLERQALHGFDMESDAALSSLLRADRIREGDGS